MITGAQAMVKCLEAQGISVVFGYPGATIAPFYDALSQSGVRHILTRGEQAAGHAASGYARITGKAAVCVVTSGPGSTNLFTALATAYADSIPLVAITGQVTSELLGHDVFQEVDTTGAVEPFTKYTYLVKDVNDIPRVFQEAFHIASTGRKGPVLIDMPMDVQKQLIEYAQPAPVNIRSYKPRGKGHPMQLKRVAQAIAGAKRPLLCAGGGVFCANAQDAVRRFVEQCNLPVVSTMMGIGVLPTAHPLYYGMIGQSGLREANRAIEESDLLILIGARVADRAIASPRRLEGATSIIHIDIDASEIGKNVDSTIPLVGDAAEIMQQLIACAPQGEWDKWLQWLRAQRDAVQPYPDQTEYVEPRRFIKLLSQKMEEDAIYLADVGENQIWSARAHEVRGGRFMTTGGMGTMGYSVPAAIGAKLAAPQRQVVAVCGDGSFQMQLTELATANQHGVAVKVIIMRNGSLGMVREIQAHSYGNRRFAVSLDGSPDFGGIAAAYGLPFWRVHTMGEASEALDAFLGSEGSAILECMVSPEEESI